MLSGEFRKSARISELDTWRSQQVKNQNERNGASELEMVQDSGTRKDSYQKIGRKRKTRPVHDLVDNTVNCQVQKAGPSNDEDHHRNSADMSSGIATPERKVLELLLNKLKRRDFYRIFAEPVDPIEVEGYYDVIKEPMDFSTVTEKLNGGSYRTLEEFEHDISLVYNNAMHFNASDTIYYKQAHAIKELANKLFCALKTDPKSFETECFVRNIGPSRRTKALSVSVNSNTCNKTTGSRDERGSQNFELQPRWTYNSRTSFLNENQPLLTQVNNSSKDLEPVKSLMRFAYNLGPTALMVAQKKLERGMTDTSNCYLQASNNQISAVEFAHMDVSSAPSFKLPRNTVSCQRHSGREVDTQSGTLNGGKAFAVDNMDIYDVLRGGIAQASSTMKTLGEIHKKRIQAPDNQFTASAFAQQGISVAPSLKVHGNSARCHALSGRELGIHGGTLFGQKISTVDTKNVRDGLSRRITHGSSTNENICGFQGNMVQTMSGGFDIGNGFNGCFWMTGDGKLDVPAEWNTNINQNNLGFVKLMLEAIHDSPEKATEAVSSGSEMQVLVPASYSCPSSSLQWPFQSMPGESSRNQAIDIMQEVYFQNLGGVHQIQGMEDREGPSFGQNMEQGRQGLNWFKSKVDGESSSTHFFGSMQGLGAPYVGGVHQIQATADEAGPRHGGNIQQGAQVSDWFKQTALGADGGRPSHGGTVNGQLSNWFKPTELGPEPIADDWFQQQCTSLTEVELLCQAEPSQQRGRAITPYDGKTMKASNMCDNDRRGTPVLGDLRIVAPADDRQKKPSRDSCFPLGFTTMN